MKAMKKKVYFSDLKLQFCMNDDAYVMLDSIEGRVSENLHNLMYDFLLGLDYDLQKELADFMVDAVIFGCEHYTDIDHIDEYLKSIYLRIDKELDRI